MTFFPISFSLSLSLIRNLAKHVAFIYCTTEMMCGTCNWSFVFFVGMVGIVSLFIAATFSRCGVSFEFNFFSSYYRILMWWPAMVTATTVSTVIVVVVVVIYNHWMHLARAHVAKSVLLFVYIRFDHHMNTIIFLKRRRWEFMSDNFHIKMH